MEETSSEARHPQDAAGLLWCEGPADPALCASRASLIARIENRSFRSLLDLLLRPIADGLGHYVWQDRPPTEVAALGAGLLLFGLGGLLSFLFKEPAYFGELRPMVVALCVAGTGTAIAAHKLTILFVSTLRDSLIPHLERIRDVELLELSLEHIFSVRRQLLFSIFVGPFVWGMVAFSHAMSTNGMSLGYSVRAVGLITGFLGATALYFVVPLLSFLPKLSTLKLRLYLANPRDSEVVAAMSSSATRALYIFTLLSTFISVLAARLGVLDTTIQKVLLLIMIWVPLGVVFLGAQHTMGQLITKSKWQYLNVLQGEIRKLQGPTGVPSPENLPQVTALMDFHDRVRATPDGTIDLSAGLNFANALLLPLVATVLANLEAILSFLRAH